MDRRVYTREVVNALVPEPSTAVGRRIARRGAIELRRRRAPCWRHGESECAFYDALSEGLSARRRIGVSVKSRLLNG